MHTHTSSRRASGKREREIKQEVLCVVHQQLRSDTIQNRIAVEQQAVITIGYIVFTKQASIFHRKIKIVLKGEPNFISYFRFKFVSLEIELRSLK